MSFGSPGNRGSFTAVPPERGSFPLDHDGECKDIMTKYLQCLKTVKNHNEGCRQIAKEYLECRMANGLMAPDQMQNLGFGSDKKLDS